MRGRPIVSVPALLFASVFVLVVIPAPAAFGAVTCSYDSTTDVVTVSMPAAGDGTGIGQVSNTDNFTVNDSPCSEPGTGTVATLKTTSLVHVVGGVGGDQSFIITLQGGYLNGLDFDIDLGGDHADTLLVLGSAGDDQIHFGSSGFLFRAVDASSGGGTGILSGGVILDVSGRQGNDVLSLAGSVEVIPPGATIGGVYTSTTHGAHLFGDEGDDALWDGIGPNQLQGGTGRDAVSYENRTVGVTITANDFADDGAPGESDLVGSDVEVLIGGSGNDTLRPGTQTEFGHTPRVYCLDPIDFVADIGTQACGGSGDDTFLSGGFGPFAQFSGGPGANDTFDASGSIWQVVITLDDNERCDDGLLVPESGVTPRSCVMDDIEVILGGSHRDHLVGSDAANRILGNGGPDRIEGGPGTDTLDGGAGPDLITYAGHPIGVDVTFDGVANDGSPGEDDTLIGFEELTGSEFADHLVGDAAAADPIRGLGGDDVIEGLGGADELVGGSGEDTLDGGEGADVLYGTSSDQDVSEHDVLHGGEGNDDLFAGAGPDELLGEEGFDSLEGGYGDDDLFGGPQNDDLDGGPDADTIDGGSGPRDKVYYDDRTGDVKVTLGGGANDGEDGEDDDVDDSVEWVFGGSGNDEFVSASRGLGGLVVDNVFVGGDGEDELKGGDGADILNGGDGDDELRGGSGQDILRGQGNEDELHGEADGDTLDGGTERDVLKGEGASDLFKAVDDDRDKVRGGNGADEAYVDPQDDVESVGTIHLVP